MEAESVEEFMSIVEKTPNGLELGGKVKSGDKTLTYYYTEQQREVFEFLFGSSIDETINEIFSEEKDV